MTVGEGRVRFPVLIKGNDISEADSLAEPRLENIYPREIFINWIRFQRIPLRANPDPGIPGVNVNIKPAAMTRGR